MKTNKTYQRPKISNKNTYTKVQTKRRRNSNTELHEETSTYPGIYLAQE